MLEIMHRFFFSTFGLFDFQQEVNMGLLSQKEALTLLRATSFQHALQEASNTSTLSSEDLDKEAVEEHGTVDVSDDQLSFANASALELDLLEFSGCLALAVNVCGGLLRSYGALIYCFYMPSPLTPFF